MALSFRSKLLASYICALLVLSVGIAAFAQFNVASNATERSKRQRTITRTALEAEVLVLRADAAQRGYFLTGDPQYLKPYHDALPLVSAKIEMLMRLVVASGAAQKQRVAQFRDHAKRKLDDLESILELHRSGADLPRAMQHHVGETLSDELLRDVNAIIQEARIEREVEEAHAAHWRELAQWFVLLGNVIAFVLAASITTWIGAAFRENQQAQRALEKQTAVLQGNAEQLAKQESALAARLAEESFLRASIERTNEALERSNADLEQFSYVVSHDLRAPLRGIASLTDWIQEDLGNTPSAEAARHFEALQDRVRRLDALVVGIGAYSRAGRGQESPEIVDVRKLVSETIDLIGPPATARFTIDRELPQIATVRVPLQQVFLNLLSNAIQHGVSNGLSEITISGSDQGAFWRFFVSDRGPGIEPQHHRRIFELFQTSGSHNGVKGTGIGLAIVKKLVERYGGDVAVESQPGAGTTFMFRWPKLPVQQVAAVAEQS